MIESRFGMTVAVLLWPLLLGAALMPSPAAAFTVEFIGADQWGAPDDQLGLAGGLVEDFEDYALAPGLTVEIADSQGQFSGQGSGVLPALFNPVSGDPFGTAFAAGVWDGSRVLLNTPTNQSQNYGSQDWRPVAIYVPEGAAWIALASQQVTVSHALVVNGQNLGRMDSYGFITGPGPNGVLIVRADSPDELVTSISFGGRGDAFTIDHVVFSPGSGEVAVQAASWDAVRAIYR